MLMRCVTAAIFLLWSAAGAEHVSNNSPLPEKARYLQNDLTRKHLLDGLYVSIVPVLPEGGTPTHSVDEPGNVIHAGVWTGRYLAGVGYQYSVTKDPKVRKHGGDILVGLRRLQEVTGKPGLLARGYVKGHGPVELFERGGSDSRHWHQGQGQYAGYRFYSDVSVDNFNAVLYGYAIYYDLAADAAQKQTIAVDVDRLMTHLLDNQYRIIDLNGEVTQYGHVGIDPEPSRDAYYKKVYQSTLKRYSQGADWRPPLRASLMVLPDLLIAYHITGKHRYIDEYRKVVARFGDNPEPARDTRPFSLERVARVNHSSEGQAYEALFNLIRYETDPLLLVKYRGWLNGLWEMNWMEGNPLFTYMTLVLTPEKWDPAHPGIAKVPGELAHAQEALSLALDTLRRYPVDRVFRPVMNSLTAMEVNPNADRQRQKQAAKPIPIDQRPLDNEYAWKGNPYVMDGWLKPDLTSIQTSCDDPMVAWFSDSTGRVYMTRDGWSTWSDMSVGLMGARVRNLHASAARTFMLYADTDRGVAVTRDGGMSWRALSSDEPPAFARMDMSLPQRYRGQEFHIQENHLLAGGKLAMDGWRIPRADWLYVTTRGLVAGGPGGAYLSQDGKNWTELKLWREEETGAADFLHAYWMGRYYGFVPPR
jgi:hypothetical protein